MLRFVNQLLFNNVPCEIGTTTKFSWGKRIEWYKEFLNNNINDKVCVVDGWDMLFFGTTEELEQKVDRPVIFSAERNCWPDKDKMEKYPNCSTPWRFVNGGAFAGNAKDLLEILNGMPDVNVPDDDQRYYTDCYLNGIGVLDTQCSLFHSLYNGNASDLVPRHGRYYNTLTKEMPCFIHGNGGSWRSREDIFWYNQPVQMYCGAGL